MVVVCEEAEEEEVSAALAGDDGVPPTEGSLSDAFD
jgi:hypothetical protein